MRTPAFLVMGLLALTCCTGSIQQQPPGSPEVIEEFMTFDLKIGGDLSDEYSIEWPRSVYSNDDGDIFVVEEGQIKVFDRDGNPKRLIGRPGTEPGEFENLHYMTISDTGYIVAAGGQFGFTFQIFSSDYELLRKLSYMWDPPYQIQMEDLNLNPDRPGDIHAYSPNELFYFLRARGDEPETRYDDVLFLIHEMDEDCRILVKYADHSMIHGGSMGTYLSFLGSLLYAVLPDRRIIYTHGEYDRTVEGDEYRYILNIVSLDDYSVKKISHPYEPVPIVEEDLSRYTSMLENARDERQKATYTELLEDARRKTEGVEFKVPLLRIMADNEYIFAWTWTKDDSSRTLVDIFDADSGRYLRSAFAQSTYPGHGSLRCIWNGYAYLARFDFENRNSSVSRFRVNPAVYVK